MQEPSLPKKRKVPSHLEVGSSTGYYHSTPKELYHQQYFEYLGLITTAIKERFNQPGYAVLLKLESLLLKAAQKEEYSEELHLHFVLCHYHNDLDASRLEPQLEAARSHVLFNNREIKSNSKNQVYTLSPVQRTTLSEICTLLKSYMSHQPPML